MSVIASYRGTSLIRNSAPLGPYNRVYIFEKSFFLTRAGRVPPWRRGLRRAQHCDLLCSTLPCPLPDCPCLLAPKAQRSHLGVMQF